MENRVSLVRKKTISNGFLKRLIFFAADACVNIEGENSAMLDNNLDTCIDVPVVSETKGAHKLFSLDVGSGCARVNLSDLHKRNATVMSLQFKTTDNGITCGEKIGYVVSDGFGCGGLTICKVSSFLRPNSYFCEYSALCPCYR